MTRIKVAMFIKTASHSRLSAIVFTFKLTINKNKTIFHSKSGNNFPENEITSEEKKI